MKKASAFVKRQKCLGLRPQHVRGITKSLAYPKGYTRSYILLGKVLSFVVVMLCNWNDITHFLCLQLHKSSWTHLVLKVQVVEKEQGERYVKLWNNVWWLHNTAAVKLIYWVHCILSLPWPCQHQHTAHPCNTATCLKWPGQGVLQVTGLLRQVPCIHSALFKAASLPSLLVPTHCTPLQHSHDHLSKVTRSGDLTGDVWTGSTKIGRIGCLSATSARSTFCIWSMTRSVGFDYTTSSHRSVPLSI